MKDLTLKVVAVVLAFGVWFFVSAPRLERVIERRFAAPLSIVGPPREFVITTPVPDTVSVRLRGRASDISSVSSQTLDVPVDVSWIQQSGDVTITIRPQAVHKPSDIEVVAIDPSKLQFHVEALRQRTVLIRPFLIGQPPPGYLVGDLTLDPDRALVSGPASQIIKMSEVSTERINMTGRTATFVQNVPVVSDTPLVRIIAPLTTQVTVPVLAEVGPNPPAETETSQKQ
ncbi:MAG TPA: CdaR family protein [Thermoanaerobaculia bacterium]|nr:CdaR family protein [Thermoanaerobaculia bacterium]